MSANQWLPAGAEESDEEDDYFYYDNPQTDDFNPSIEKTVPLNETPEEEVKPKRDSLIEIQGYPNGFLLNDIRMTVINGNLENFRQMIETSTDNQFFVDTILTAGWTPLMYASNCGHKDIVHYLLERGADPNYHNNLFTPLMAVGIGTVSEEDLIASARYLISFGANVNAVDSYGNTAIIYAAKSGKSGLTQELIDNNGDINRPNNDGWNALHFAVRDGYGKVIEKLLSNGIDVTSKTNSSQSAAEIALSKGHQKINEILENIKIRISADTNEVESEEHLQNRRLSEEEINQLNGYVKPHIEFKCREKSEQKPRVPNTKELSEFLSQTNYEHLLPEFEKNNFGYQDLVTNTEDVLRQIGVEDSATIRKISAHIILLHKQDWKKESLKDLDLDTTITCPELLMVLSNICNHLSRIDQTIVFLKNRVTDCPEILSYNTDITPQNKVLSETLQSLINTRSLFNDLQQLRNKIESIENISEPQNPEVLNIPFTLEDELNNKKSSKYSKSLFLTLLSLGAFTFGVKYGYFNKENLSFIIQSIPRPKFPKFNSILITL